jgi:hypothetical protein
MIEEKQYRGINSKRKVILLGDENGIRYFSFETNKEVVCQCKVDLWEEMFEEIK